MEIRGVTVGPDGERDYTVGVSQEELLTIFNKRRYYVYLDGHAKCGDVIEFVARSGDTANAIIDSIDLHPYSSLVWFAVFSTCHRHRAHPMEVQL